MDGHSGQRSVGGRNVRVCRCEARVTQSPSSGSNRIWDCVETGGRSRRSTAARSVGMESK
ncbi:Uncharacterised protein [Mycobacteroides abscessus subsp. abscessus]|nr:Uncharacterised protein [Mycobacteroides abscessus subsp. abscessus]SKT83213.1 Uncharacterised protein [Mycobacteroides abscessus subsp. abscessus]